MGEGFCPPQFVNTGSKPGAARAAPAAQTIHTGRTLPLDTKQKPLHTVCLHGAERLFAILRKRTLPLVQAAKRLCNSARRFALHHKKCRCCSVESKKGERIGGSCGTVASTRQNRTTGPRFAGNGITQTARYRQALLESSHKHGVPKPGMPLRGEAILRNGRIARALRADNI